ncbi:hypothetical protein ACFVTM_13995 [Arthrobacter sp. NPDC058130]|uniref:hypothetical protein n=1 Tax=Arthrobacter sp. NPDC058130 TaxID=3346353 RepID=UPI0036E63D66
MASCAECRARQQRERQYLEKLRGAAVPEASDDLTARLLARTGQLAAERSATEGPVTSPEQADLERHAAEEAAADWTFAGDPSAAGPPQDGRRRGLRLPALVVGGAVAALAIVAGTGYAMGGDPAAPADGADASAAAHPEAGGQAGSGAPPGAGEMFASGSDSAGVPGSEVTGPRVGLGLGGEPDFTPAGTLSAGQLAAFRSQGWICPELRDLGFHLIWARAGVMSGDVILELRLTDGQHFATVLEQHASPPRAAGTSPGTPPVRARADASPVNVLTGHAAVADGFTRARPGAPSALPESGSGTLWVNPAPPYRAIYQTDAATYTYVSDLPAEQADDGVTALTRVSSGTAASGPRDGITERIERGLSRILEHLAP